MELLWAPWRMRYIKAERPEGCIFCTKPTVGDDAAAHIVWRGRNAFVLLNTYPYNNGHLMVAPYAHVGELQDLPFETAAELMTLSQDAIKALQQDFSPDGFNIGLNLGVAAGAGIKDHVHVHVVPRWSGDTNFMPVTGDVRVIPQSLDHAYGLLHAAFAELKA